MACFENNLVLSEDNVAQYTPFYLAGEVKKTKTKNKICVQLNSFNPGILGLWETQSPKSRCALSYGENHF